MNKLNKYAFSDLYDIASGISTTKIQAGHGTPFVSFSTVFNNIFLPDELPDLMDTSEQEQETYSIRKGDILITRTSETADELAMSCVALKDYPGATYSGFVKRLRPKTIGVAYDKFMAFFLRSKYFRKVINNNTIMTLRASFNEDMFSFLTLYLPDYDVQVAVGDLLYNIECKIQNNKRINDNLAQQLRLLYDYWFTQFDFPDESGNPYRSSGGQMVWNNGLKRKIPESWCVVPLGEVSSFRNGINYDKNTTGDTTYHIVNVRNISSSSILLDERELDGICLPCTQAEKYLVSNESILIARSGIPGAPRILYNPSEDIIFCGFIICATPIDSILQHYLMLFLKQLEGSTATQTGGSILKNVSQDTLRDLLVPIPSKDILTQFNQRVALIYEFMHNNLEETSKLQHLRDWLLPMLMNGQATISD